MLSRRILPSIGSGGEMSTGMSLQGMTGTITSVMGWTSWKSISDTVSHSLSEVRESELMGE